MSESCAFLFPNESSCAYLQKPYTPNSVRQMAQIIRDAGTLPELECFDSGDLVLAQTLLNEGVLPKSSIYTLVTGVRYALPSSPEALMFGKSLIPSGMHWSAFGIGRMAFPVVAQAWLLGGHVRIGLEDTIYSKTSSQHPLLFVSTLKKLNFCICCNMYNKNSACILPQ